MSKTPGFLCEEENTSPNSSPVQLRWNKSTANSRGATGTSFLGECPVCTRRIPSSNLVAHVNSCLDNPPAAQVDDLDIPSPPPSQSSHDDSVHVGRDAPPDPRVELDISTPDEIVANTSAHVPKKSQHMEDSNMSTVSWLKSFGMSKYTPGFLLAGFRSLGDLLSATALGDDKLRDCGVKAMGARKKIASELALAAKKASASAARSAGEVALSCPSTELSKDAETSRMADSNASKSVKRKVWAIFEPGYRAAESSPLKIAKVQNANRNAFARSPHGQTNGKAYTRSPRGQANGTASPKNPRGPRKHSFAHRVAGTAFTIDSFSAAKSDPTCAQFFLSHFHSDHYGPLRKSTLPKGARVLCSAVTASLVHKLLSVPKESIQVLELNKKLEISDGTDPKNGASVWLFDANHCPGAVIFLFFVWQTSRYVLHTGDCRFDPEIFNRYSKLAEVIRDGRLDFLHLDTTYCDPQYAFPHQDNVLSQVVQFAQQEDKRTRGRCIFFFGTYSIGKEKVFFAVAEALNLKIYTGKRKRGILEQCQFGARRMNRFVSSAGEARVQVVSMRALSSDGLREYATRNSLNTAFIGRGLAIVFKPTGWTFKGNPEKPRRVNRSADHAMVYEVPYSEHSSYAELREFVKWAKPNRLIPTVNARSTEQANNLKKILGHEDRPLYVER